MGKSQLSSGNGTNNRHAGCAVVPNVMHVARVICGGLACAALVACGANRDRPTFDDQEFRAKANGGGRENREIFTISVKPVSRSLDGAREAGRYEATRYCIETFGTSDIVWTAGPDAVDEELQIDNDTLQLSGACVF